MPVFYHGTSLENARKIAKDGFLRNPDNRNGTVSDNAVYFWSADKLKESEGLDDDCLDFMIQQGWGGATAALAYARQCIGVVFEVELPEEALDCDDYSCENMEGAVEWREDVPASAIRRIFISDDFTLAKGCFIFSLLSNSMAIHDFTDMEQTIAEAMSTLYLEEIFSPELEEIGLDTLLGEC
jgi:hypothetical protein